MKKKYGFILIPAVAMLILTSCTTHKKLVYLQKVDSVNAEAFYPKSRPLYRIQNRDILYIRIYTMNQEISDLINQTMGATQQNMFQNESNMYINGYNVNDSGFVEIPVLGPVLVMGKTIDEITQAIRQKASLYLKDATVIVKLVSFKFSVIGEVARPGTYSNYNNQLTVLEALSMAGDITDYGNRSNVLVLRPDRDGTKTFRLDLTSKGILASNGFFLLPNDIVYVEPVKNKILKLNIPTISLGFSVVSTVILILNYIQLNK